jgi:hypothetical protein
MLGCTADKMTIPGASPGMARKEVMNAGRSTGLWARLRAVLKAGLRVFA